MDACRILSRRASFKILEFFWIWTRLNYPTGILYQSVFQEKARKDQRKLTFFEISGKKKSRVKRDLVSYAVVEKDFFNSSTSTFLMTGVRVNCLIRFTRALAFALFLLSFLFNRVTPMVFSKLGRKYGKMNFGFQKNRDSFLNIYSLFLYLF